MAAPVPSPADESNAPPAKRSLAVKATLDLLCRFALGAVALSCAAGCSDRPLVLVGPPSSSTLRDGLVGLWHLDEVTGTTVADSSGHGNDGKLSGFADPASVWIPGKFGNALAVNAEGYVQVPLSASIDGIASGVTVSAWVYFDGTIADANDFGTAISRQISSGMAIDQYYHLSLRGPDGAPNLFVSPTVPSTLAVTAAKGVPRSTWVHLAGTYEEVVGNTSPEILYVNGEVANNKMMISGRFATDNTPLILGGNANMSTVSERFPGRIDEIALYNRSLSADEIAELARGPVL